MNLYDILEKLNIEFEEIEHEPVYTIEEAMNIQGSIKGTGCKNLFLHDKKKHYYLVILEESKRADIKKIANFVGKSGLSFASAERLKEVLGLETGSVTPFGIINDKEKRVVILLDKELSAQKLLFHPNINSKTISIGYEDLIKFIEEQGHSYRLI